MYALYQVSVRQATISLSLLLAHTSRCKPWESLWGSSATTPLVDFHHRLTACPSYKENVLTAHRNKDVCLPWYHLTSLTPVCAVGSVRLRLSASLRAVTCSATSQPTHLPHSRNLFGAKLRDVFTKQLHHAPLIIRLLSVFAVICYLFPSTLVSYVAILAYCARFVNPLLSDAPALRQRS